MPGFGSGPFGGEPAGEFEWSRVVLYDLMPEIYRRLDPENGGYLDKLVEAERPLWDYLRRKIRSFADLRDAFYARSKYTEVVTLTLGMLTDTTATDTTVEVRSIDAGDFGILDIGPGWVLFDGANRVTVLRRQQYSDEDRSLLPYPLLKLQGRIIPKGVIEQEGTDGERQGADPVDTFRAVSANFSSGDVGKWLTITGTLNPTQTVRILTVYGPNRVQIDGTLVVESGMTWDLRIQTVITGLANTKVQVYASSMLELLAKDFGIVVDEQETDLRQRRWVRNVTQWILRKGTAKGYEIVSKISGFDIETYALFRITADMMALIPDEFEHEVGDFVPGRSGLDGSLTLGTDGRPRIYSPTAEFKLTDVGSNIRTTSLGGYPENNRVWTIEEFVDANNVIFRMADRYVSTPPGPPPTIPDTVTWAVIRIYTTLKPARPLFDEIEPDVLEDVVPLVSPGKEFGLDHYCWEDTFSTEIPSTVLSISTVTAIGGDYYELKIAPGGAPPVSEAMEAIKKEPNWIIRDNASNEYTLEAPPGLLPADPIVTFSGGFYYCYVRAAVPPVVGPAAVFYDCPVEMSCDYCAASKILVILTADDILGDVGVALERVIERLILRLRNTTPAHVQLVLVIRWGLDAYWSITASMEDWVHYLELIAPFTAYYDEITGDEITTDTTILVTLTGPFIVP